MKTLNRAIDGAALYKDMMQKVEAGAVPSESVSPEVADWNAEVNRKRAEKLACRMKAHDNLLRAELAKVSQR